MGNNSSTEQQYQQQHAASSRGRRHESSSSSNRGGSATGASTAQSNGPFGGGPQPRHHKTRRSQESQRRRRRSRTQQSSASPSATTQRSRRSDDNSSSSNNSSSDNSNSDNSNSSSTHSNEQPTTSTANDASPPLPPPPPASSTDCTGKIHHSLSDATASSTGSSSPELLNDAIDALRVRVGPSPPSHPATDHADLLASLRLRYHGALPWLAHGGDGHADGIDHHVDSGSTAADTHPDSSMLGTVLHQLACLHWRDYVPCTRESEDTDADMLAAPTSPASSTLPTLSSSIGSSSSTAKGNRVRSTSSFFQSYDAKVVAEQKHKAFWELVQQLLTLNDAVVMIRLLLTYLQVHIDAATCAVFLIDQTTHVTSRFAPHETSVSGIDPARGVLGKTLATREAVCCMNFAVTDASYDAEVDLDQTWPKQKLLCVPLIENDVVYAVIQATTKAPTRRDIDQLHMKLLSWLGPILGACMRKCIEFHDVLLSDRTQKALLHILSSSDTEDTVLNLVDGVIAGACHITKAERVTLFMVDWDTDELWSLSSSYHAETLRLPLRASASGHAALTRTILNISDPATDARYSQRIDRRRGVPTRCALYVPVGVQNASNEGSSRPIAVLEILNKVDGHEFTFDDECAFEAFASQVAVILRRRSNEIEYLKLLADTRAEKVLAQRAKSQVNILEQYTSYSSTMRGHAAAAAAATAAAARRGSFARSPARDCVSCTCRNDVPVDAQRCRLHNSAGAGLTNASSWHKALERQLSKSSGLGPSIPSWDFNVFLADMDALPDMVFDMFCKFSVPTVLGISKQRMRNFIAVVRANYHPNPFHNFVHAFSVVHTAFLLLSTTSAARMLQPLDIAGCLIAALCHDVDHPGHTNAYEIQSGSQLAMLYSDESVLERHHAYTTFKLIAKEKNANILEHLTPTDYRHIRKVIITAILGTDMAGHFKFCETLEKTLHPPARHFSAASLVSSGSGTGGTGSGGGVAATATTNSAVTTANLTNLLHKPLDGEKGNSASAGSLVGHTPSLASLTGLPGLVSTSTNATSTSEIRNVLRDAVFQSEQGSAATTPRNNGNSSSAPAMGFCFPKPFASAPSLATLASAASSVTSTSSLGHDKSASSISSDSTINAPTNGSNGWNFTGSVDDRIFLVKTIVHASDLSGQVFTKPVALKWSNMISKEFAYQALLEQAENHPVSYHDLNNPVQMVEGQLFFAQKIVAPLWDLVHTLFPEVAVCVQNLADNVAHYEHELQRLKIATCIDETDERCSTLSDALAINGNSGVGSNTVGAQTIGSATIESLCFDDEGLAVPGLAKCTPARFNSFRSIREVSESYDEGDNTWNTELSLRDFAASAVAAIERERQSRRSSGDDDEDDDDNDNAFDEFDAGDYAALMGVQT